jgi:hypothetical protein
VIDLMEALRASVAQRTGTKAAPAAPARKPPRKVAAKGARTGEAAAAAPAPAPAQRVRAGRR